jgi:hypothetical protein
MYEDGKSGRQHVSSQLFTVPALPSQKLKILVLIYILQLLSFVS